MPNVSPIQSSFNGGEISPLLYGRVDVPRYKESLAVCKNYIPLIQGPKTRRPGTGFVFPVKDQTAKTVLIPFEFSTTQAYMLEFGNLYVRFFKNNGIITLASYAISAITQANPAVVTVTGHPFLNGDHIILSGIKGMTELNNREFTVTWIDANTISIGVDSTGYSAYATSGTAAKIYEVVTPYLTADLPKIQYTQSNDVLYLTHGSYAPQKLTRTSDTNWTMTQISFQDGPYLDENITAGTTLTTNRHAGPAYLSLIANQTNDINNGAGFLATDVGRVIRFKDPSTTTWWWATIASIISTTEAKVNQSSPGQVNYVNFPAGGIVCVDWRLGVWNSADGFPSTVVFHQDRLVFGGAGGKPTRFDGSNASNYEAFAPSDSAGTVSAANAYNFSLNSNDVNKIHWMNSDEQGLIIGTTGGEWRVTASDGVSAITATSVSAKKATSLGSEPVRAVQSGKCTLYVQRGARKLREMNYYFDVSGFRSADMTQMAEHITNSGIIQLAVQKVPQPIVWAVRTDGVLLAMTYERELDALKAGWSRHIMGGSFSTGNACVESVAVIPTADGTSQDVWVVVKRTINGVTARYIEYITQLFDTNAALSSAIFVDSSLTYNGAATTTISGLNHLNGQVVSILADGGVQPDRAVVNGKLTLDSAASIVTIGLSYNSDGQKLRTDAGASDGTAMAKTRRTHRLGLMLLNTLGFKLGADFSTLDDINLDDTEAGILGVAPTLFSGIITQNLTTDYDFDNMICWRQSQPLPGTIQGLYPHMVTQDRG